MEQKEAQKREKEAKRQSTAVRNSKKRGIGQVVQAEEIVQAKRVKVVTCTTSRGRAVAQPQRFN